ncbi:MAG: hypothetical protein LBH68_05305 [Bifidobacteriaceae bacterium]|jgi:signal transduction histidine kinase|nr:hypothetical protein [Bifidobacteriaceae bacterium]
MGEPQRSSARASERWIYLSYVVPLMAVICVSLAMEWIAVTEWASWPVPQIQESGAGMYLLGVWCFSFVPGLIAGAALVPFYPAGESWTWRLVLAAIASLLGTVLRVGVEFAVWGPMYMVGPIGLELILSFFVPFGCISVSMYLAKSQVRAVEAERQLTEMAFQERQSQLERENAELRIRRDVSRLLHDQVQQRLVFTASRLQSELLPMAAANDDLLAVDLLKEIIADIDRLREHDVRQLSQSLFPTGADLGLAPALGLAVSRVPPSLSVDMAIEQEASGFDTVLEPELDVTSRAVLIKALDEAITNAIKHGGATKLKIRMGLEGEKADRRIYLTVDNDGQPVGENPVLSGLTPHQERLTARGGGLFLGLNDRGQTRVKVWLPAPEPAPAPASG